MSLAYRIRGYFIVAALMALLSTSAFAAELQTLISDAQAALQRGEAALAYSTMADSEQEYAGNTEFDYWFGLCAVRAGEAARASFVLERVVVQEPHHAAARLELAAAYLQLGQREAASEQLDRLAELSPPPEAKKRISALNAELNRQQDVLRARRNGGYVGAEAGDDDNVGTWPEGLEFFPGVSLEAIDSMFYSLKGGYWHKFDVTADQSVAVSGNFLLRRNQEEEAEQFDQDYLGARAEWVKDIDGRDELAASAELGGLNLDGESYYTLYGVGTEWRQSISDQTRFITGLKLRQLQFDLDQYDHLMTRLLGRIAHRPGNGWDLNVDLTVDYEAANNDRAGGDGLVYGLSGVAWYTLSAKHRVGGSVAISRADYRSEYGLGEAINTETGAREDDRISVSLLYDWLPGSRWQVRGQALYREQDSSLEAFTYDQTVLSAGLNYYF